MTDDRDLDMTAAELALGVLDGDERAAAVRRVLAEPVFAREVEAWRAHFAQLFDLWPEVAASDGVRERIEGSLGGGAAPVPAPAPRRSAWPLVAMATSAIAACLLLFVVTRPAPPVPVPVPVPVVEAPVAAPASVLVASIDPVKKGTPLAALYDPAHAELRINASVPVEATQSPQLWVIAGDGVPHSLGLLRATATAFAVDAENRTRLGEGATLAVSIEPLGGSPKPTPTGPVVAAGKLQRV